uniref:SET domain bifurcated histone lysine methyltransferase 2 n=1 Tax=Caenorhabditis tropicalis TaxID=1561998 RepID=A0A1I7UEA7_9PELO
MKSNENVDLDLKAKRIVYQMTKELERTDFNDDFHTVLLSLKMSQIEKKAGFDGYLKLQNEVKESLKNYMNLGEKADLLSLLSGQQMKCLNQMLKKGRSRETESSGKERKIEENGEYFGEKVVAKKVQVVEVIEDPPRIPFGIPPLQVDELYDNLDDWDESDEWVSSQPGRSSSRIPEIPMEPVPKPVKEPEKNVKFEVIPPKKIVSRARQIQKNDAQIQTDEVVEKEEKEPEIQEKTQPRAS